MKSIDFDQVADLYDTLNQADYDLAFFLDCAKNRREVLELTCGTGRVSIPLIRTGVKLTCVDYSAGMLAELRKKLEAEDLHAEVIEMDVRALDLGRRFPLIIFPFNSFSELLDDGQVALAAIREHLEPGGQFVLTLHNPPARIAQIAQGPMERRISRDDGSSLLFRFEGSYDLPTRRVTARQIYRQLDTSGELQSERELPIQFVLPDPDEVVALANSCGLELVERFGDYDRSSFDSTSSPYAIAVLTARG